MKILKFKKSLKHYLKLIEQRKQENDTWGVLEATKNALENAKTKTDKNGLLMLLASCYFEMEEYNLSNTFFFQTATIPHLKAGSFFGIGRNLVLQKRFNLALDYFELSLSFDTFSIFAEPILEWTKEIKRNMDDISFEHKNLQEKAKRLIIQKDFKEAEKILESLQSDTTTLTLLAVLRLFQKDFGSAERLSKQVLLNEQENPLANIVLIDVFNHFGKTQAFNHLLQKMENFSPEKFEDNEKLGLVFSKQKNFSVALKFFKKCLEKKEFCPRIYLFCALCLQNLKNNTDALYYLSHARWIDFENPIYVFFFELLHENQNFSFDISKKLPKEIEKQKIENILEIFYSGKMEETLTKSHTLLLDVEWIFSLEDEKLWSLSSEALSNSGSKKSKNLLRKILLSPAPSQKEKYVITKNMLLSKNFFQFHIVSNMHFSSFSLKKNELQKFNPKFLRAVSKAVSFSECFFPQERLLEKIFLAARKIQNDKLLQSFSSNILSCLLLFPYPKVFENACEFFCVDKKQVENIKTLKGDTYDKEKLS